jgi:transcription elongation factor GreA
MAEHTIEKKLMTYSGLKKLEDELNNLKVNERREIAQKIKEAREQGDLSENAEYDAAKDEQRDIEARIEEIENILKHVEVIADEDITTDVINLGTKVRVLDKEFDEEDEFSIVGTNEADSLKGKISNESPVGRALLGHRVGEEIMGETQVGILHYLVLGIERAEEYAGAAGA